ncbi:LysR family transcriptional regulator [Rhodobacteraceae bacterium CCMM004]|nr:LysR family transcriptional regulator [Rhodobacteraceae bacterium CCMM004]
MEWKSVTFDWNRARAFLVTAEEGSLSAAARALGMAQPTLGRQVAALEAALGVALFERTGRGQALTPAGHDLLAHVQAMGEAARALSLAAEGRSRSIAGPITVTASEITAARQLPAIVARLREVAPGLTVEIVASNESQDLRRREADIAVRNYRPTDPDLFARKIGDGHARLYGAPHYLDRLGPLHGAADLARAEIVGFVPVADFLRQIRAMGVPVTEDNVRVATANHLVHLELVRAGVGLSFFPEPVGDGDPDLARAVPAMAPFVYPLWVVAHREVSTSARVRLVFDLLAEMLS